MSWRNFAVTPSRLLVFALLIICAPLVLLLRIGYGVTFGVLVIVAYFAGTFVRINVLTYLLREGIYDPPQWLVIVWGKAPALATASFFLPIVGVHAVIVLMRAVLPKDFRYHTAYIGLPTIPITKKFDRNLLPFIVLAPALAYIFPQYFSEYVDFIWIPSLAVMAVAYYALLSMTRADNTLAAFDPVQRRYKAPKKTAPTLVSLAAMPSVNREDLNAIFSRRPEGLAKLARP